MNLGEKLKNLINNYQEGNKLKVYSTSSEDQHKTVHEFTWDSDLALRILKGSLDGFEKYGDCAGSDPKGQWIINFDFELI